MCEDNHDEDGKFRVNYVRRIRALEAWEKKEAKIIVPVCLVLLIVVFNREEYVSRAWNVVRHAYITSTETTWTQVYADGMKDIGAGFVFRAKAHVMLGNQ